MDDRFNSETEQIVELLGIVDEDMEIPEGDYEGEEELCLQLLKKHIKTESDM